MLEDNGKSVGSFADEASPGTFWTYFKKGPEDNWVLIQQTDIGGGGGLHVGTKKQMDTLIEKMGISPLCLPPMTHQEYWGKLGCNIMRRGSAASEEQERALIEACSRPVGRLNYSAPEP